ARGIERTPPRLPKHHLRGEIIDAAVCILAFMRPMAPELIIPHKLCMPVIHLFALGAAHDIGIEHAALDRKAAFRPILPGMALRRRGPLDIELAETRG